MTTKQTLRESFSVREARSIMRFLRRMESHAQTALARSREMRQHLDNSQTRNQEDHWKKALSTIRWEIGLLNQSHPNR